jgi:hypothetical protein
LRKTIKSVLQIATVSAAMLLLSIIVAGAGLYLGGVVTDEKLRDIARVVDGELASPPEEPAAQPVKGEMELQSEAELKTAVAQWHKERKAQEEALAARKEASEAMRRELSDVAAELTKRTRDLDTRVAQFEQARAAEEAARLDAGFREAVKRYDAMEPADVAKLLYGLEDAAVLRYLQAFRADRAAEVLTGIMKLDEKSAAGRAAAALNRAAKLQEMMCGDGADVAANAPTGAVR